MTDASPERVTAVDWWLSQGDIFADIPLIDTFLGSGVPAAAIPRGHALLVTHDCMLDKHNRRGTSQVESLTFLRLIDVKSQMGNKPDDLRRTKDDEQPYRALYLGEVSGFGEAFVDINAPFTHPVAHFGLESKEFDEKSLRIFPTINSKRLERITDPLLELFRTKWNANWTGFKPNPLPKPAAQLE